MIIGSSVLSFDELGDISHDIFVYALGFEARATSVASRVLAKRGIAIRLPEKDIFSYRRNKRFAETRKHLIVTDFEKFLGQDLPTLLEKSASKSVGIDISSMDRRTIFALLEGVACRVQSDTRVYVYYSPSAFSPPDWQFPIIERFGPIDKLHTAFDTDPLKPLLLIVSAGFEYGVAAGLISQLEPARTYVFWGSGVDSRFDDAVKKANFNFDFGAYDVRAVEYNILDPAGVYALLEAIVFRLSKRFRVVIVPMGPKAFVLQAVLVGMAHLGEVAIWRAQQDRIAPPDAKPIGRCVTATLNTQGLIEYAKKRYSVTG